MDDQKQNLKTNDRWEDDQRTMVVYKESQELAKKDPKLDVTCFSRCHNHFDPYCPTGVDRHLQGRATHQPPWSTAGERFDRNHLHSERLETRCPRGAKRVFGPSLLEAHKCGRHARGADAYSFFWREKIQMFRERSK